MWNAGTKLVSSVDVIVPCYQYGRFLVECVESVLLEQQCAVRVLIIDDASPDETPDVATELARQDDRVTWRRHATNQGHIATYNEGLDWASADYMLLLSADDIVTPGALGRAARLMDAHPEVGLTYGPVVNWHGGEPPPPRLLDSPVPGWTVVDGNEFIRRDRYAWRSDPVETSAAVVRTSVQKRVGGYRPELPHAGDYEMWLRFAAHGQVGRLNALQGVYRRHRGNMSEAFYNDKLEDISQRVRAAEMFLDASRDRIPDADALRQHMMRDLARQAVDSASDMFARGNVGSFERLLQLAGAMDPAVRYELSWQKQTIKRVLGPRVWAAVKTVGLAAAVSRRHD
jgi:glycosyltransferase involved in cell wall biosynthesis